MKSFTKLAAAFSILASIASASPAAPLPASRYHAKRAQNLALNTDFPDPSLEQDFDGTWYAFGTNGNGKKIQVAHANTPDGPWTLLAADALPDAGAWTTQADIWAPDVKRLATGKYIMYYSAAPPSDPTHHCIGAATATSIVGPYTPLPTPVACPLAQGGAIDASAFYDASSNTRWMVYKVDGNSIGHGGDCNNGVAPLVPTPLMLQQMNTDDWVTPVGAPIQILDRSDDDGPLVEAPNIIRAADGTYMLFYSSYCYTDPQYDVKYATASSLQGPYTRKGQVLKTGDYGNLASPGGATATPSGNALLFHANCTSGRCMHVVDMNIAGGAITLT